MQAITSTEDSSTRGQFRPALPSEKLDDLRRCARAVVKRGMECEIEERDAPSGALRAALVAHAGALRVALRPAAAGHLGRFIAEFFTYFPNFSGGGDAAEFEMATYAKPLSCFPEWALRYALEKAESSRERYRPSLPILKGWADDAIRPLRDELDKIELVLGATIISPRGAVRGKPLVAKLRAMSAGLERIAADRPVRGELMSPSMTARLAGDKTIPLTEFVAAFRDRAETPSRAPTGKGSSHDR